MTKTEGPTEEPADESPAVDPVVAIHEAGHAVARYVTAAEMGYSTGEIIHRIEIAADDPPTAIGTSADGTMALFSEGATRGPMFAKDMNAAAGKVIRGRALLDGTNATGPLTGDALAEIVATARAEGADIDAWLRARALQAVFGPMVEAAYTQIPFEEIWNGNQAQSDAMSFFRDCALAGVADVSGIQRLLDGAIQRGNELLKRADVCRAVSALGLHLSQNGTTAGPIAVRIIEQAMRAV